MKKYRQFFVLAIMFLSAMVLWGNELLLPVLAGISYSSIVLEFIIQRNKIKKGKIIPVGSNNAFKWSLIASVIFGIFLINYGIYGNPTSLNYHGIDSNVFVGVLFILIGIFDTRRSLFLLANKTVTFNNSFGFREWSLLSLDKVILRKDRVIFIKGDEKYEFNINNEDQLKAILGFIRPRIEEKLLIE